jgi:hypothetical protein
MQPSLTNRRGEEGPAELVSVTLGWHSSNRPNLQHLCMCKALKDCHAPGKRRSRSSGFHHTRTFLREHTATSRDLPPWFQSLLVAVPHCITADASCSLALQLRGLFQPFVDDRRRILYIRRAGRKDLLWVRQKTGPLSPVQVHTAAWEVHKPRSLHIASYREPKRPAVGGRGRRSARTAGSQSFLPIPFFTQHSASADGTLPVY